MTTTRFAASELQVADWKNAVTFDLHLPPAVGALATGLAWRTDTDYTDQICMWAPDRALPS